MVETLSGKITYVELNGELDPLSSFQINRFTKDKRFCNLGSEFNMKYMGNIS